MIFKGYSERTDLRSKRHQQLRRSFLRNGPKLCVPARALTYIPGGPVPKIIIMWRYPIGMPVTSPEEFLQKTSSLESEIKANLPKYESRLATADIKKAVARVKGPNGVSA